MDANTHPNEVSFAQPEKVVLKSTPKAVEPILNRGDSSGSVGVAAAPVHANNEIVDLIRGSMQPVMDEERRKLEAKIRHSRVLIVDDEELVVITVEQFLKQAGYTDFSTCTDSRQALEIARTDKPDLILLDLNMPHVNGLQILHEVNIDKELRQIPVVVLTAESDPMIRNAALELGCNDFLSKPVDPAELIPRVRNALIAKKHFDELGQQKTILEKTVERRTRELYESRQQLILSLARAAEHRDNDTGNHVIRVGCYAGIIAKQLGWNADAVAMIQQAAQLHDVGKLGIPDEILFKPGKLDEDEYNLMKHHCALGKRIITPFDARERELLRSHARVGQGILYMRDSPLMMMASRIAQTHHEHWDGRGYPLGLAGEDIPIEGRITAVADVYDALSSKRPYKDAFPRQKCFDILTESRGTQFDPTVLDAFFDCSKEIIEVQMEFMDD